MTERHSVLPVEPTPEEALSELKELLLLAASELFPPRLAASRYTICRDALLRSAYKPLLPGFLMQCLTIARFREFIHLYDPAVGARVAFINESFRGTEIKPRQGRTFDIFDDSDF